MENEECTMNNVHWKKVRLGDVGEIISGGTPSTSNEAFWDGGVLFVTPLDLGRKKDISSTIRTISELGVLNSSANKIKMNSLAVSTRAPIGLMSIVNEDFTTNQGCKSIQFFENFDSQFFYYYLSYNVEHLRRYGQGTTFMEISKTDFANIEISVPSLPAQRRIAAILSAADKMIEQTRQLIVKYKSIKQGLMEDLLKPKEGWKKVKLGDCCITELGKTLDEGRNTGEYRPYLCALNVLWGKIDRTTIKQMRIEDDELNRYAVKKGDLLVCEGGEIGRCAIWDYDDTMYYQNALHRVRFFNGYDSMFFMYLLCYYNDLNLLEQHGKGLTIKHLNQTSFRSIPVSVPDLSEQRRIAKILSGIDRKIEAEEKVLEKYTQLKKGLMEKLLNEKEII